MGDDNEIRQLIRRESENFLKKALDESRGVIKAYNFEQEFSRTKKNKSFVVLGATLATIIAMGAAALGVTRVIEKAAEATPVDIGAFEALNLRDLLDTAKRDEAELEEVKMELVRLEFDLKAGMDAADRAYAAEIESIAAKGLPESERKAQEAKAAAARDAEKKRLQDAYDAKPLKAKIADIQSRVDKYDQRLMDQANKQKAILDNERRLFEIEKEKQRVYYETRINDLDAKRRSDIAELKRQRDELAASLTLRYNPVFEDSRTASLVSGWKAPSKAPAPKALPPYLEAAGILDKDAAKRLDDSLADYRYLSSKLKAVPYLNSVPPTLARLEWEATSSIESYRAALAAATAGMEERDAKIKSLEGQSGRLQSALDKYNWAVSEYVRSKREGGYILDPRDPKSMTLVMNPAIPVADGDVGFVIRDENVIATISFAVKGGETAASIVEQPGAAGVQPFDTIIVQVKPDAQK